MQLIGIFFMSSALYSYAHKCCIRFTEDAIGKAWMQRWCNYCNSGKDVR